MKLPTWAKWLLGLFAVLVVIAIVSGVYLFQKVSNAPRTWNVEANVQISAPAMDVEPLVASLERWKEWSAWRRDFEPDVRRSLETLPDGVQRLAWGEVPSLQITLGGGPVVKPGVPKDSIGHGDLTLQAQAPGRYRLETRMKDRFAVAYVDPSGANASAFTIDSPGHVFTADGELTVEAGAEGGTKVTWRESGNFGEGFTLGLVALAAHEFVADQHVAALRSSLERLKQLAEKQAR